jgi:predicted small secreted protein
MKIQLLLLVFVVSLVLSGCNTIRGIGKDIEKVGEAISRT